MRPFVFAALALALTASIACAQTTAPSGAYWDYFGKTGPLGWGKLDPAYQACAKGHEQSPIDIRGAHLNKALPPVEFHYIGGPVTVENTGHTILVHPAAGSYIVYEGTRYDLQQFHFHHPAEEAVRGKLTDMDVHLVHKSADGKLLVIAVRFTMDRGSPNAVMAMLWPHMPKTTGATEKVNDVVNPGGFLPADRGYWTYTGSLSAPPCTEGVRWIIYENDLSLSLDQLRTFMILYRMNSRPLQDPHGRRIEANE
jgi:carbonic anhydrase